MHDSVKSRGSSRRLALWVAIGFGVGRAPFAPGTFGTLIAVAIYWAISGWPAPVYGALVVGMFFAGVVFCRVAAQELGNPDPKCVVWDEIVGYLLTMFLAPPGWPWIIVGFVCFRVFDIWKPFPIRRLERKLGGGWGIMLDDVLAGLYAWGSVQLLAWTGVVGAWSGRS